MNKNDLAKQDIEFTPQIDIVKNLNKGTFNTSYLLEDSYYKVCDTPILELKAKIEKAIKEKFNETSDILDDFNWYDAEPGEAYDDVIKQSEKYDGNTKLGEKDTLKIPNISFNLKEELSELENKPFFFSTGEQYSITKALQTIEFELDKKGGKVRSEAGMMVEKFALAKPDEETREFLIDDTFTIFLKEEEKDLPYFAARIEDITKVQ